MKQLISMISALVLCLILCSCSGRQNPVTETSPTEIISPEIVHLTKEEMLDISKRINKPDIENILNDHNFAKSLVGSVYTFDGIVYSIESDYAAIGFSIKDGEVAFEPALNTIAAEVYLSVEELSSIEVLQKVSFVGELSDVKINEENTIQMFFDTAAIKSDRFESLGKLKEQIPDYESNTWSIAFPDRKELGVVTFAHAVDFYKGSMVSYSYKIKNGECLDAQLLTPDGEWLSNAPYDPFLDDMPEILDMAPPKLSFAEVQNMVAQNMSLDDVADRIDTLADLLQYLHQRGYTVDNGDLHFRYGEYEWSVNRSAETVLENNMGNCGGGSNLVNYILRDDFDEQGYVQEVANQGGHIYNYFMRDGMYYFFDLTQIRMSEHRTSYNIFATDDPQKFSDYYIGDNHKRKNAESPSHLLLQYMYECEGSHFPIGWGNERTVLNMPYGNILPKQYENIITILFVDEGVSGPVFVNAPEQNRWPEEAQ